jgi:hypothetical protein
MFSFIAFPHSDGRPLLDSTQILGFIQSYFHLPLTPHSSNPSLPKDMNTEDDNCSISWIVGKILIYVFLKAEIIHLY